MGLTSVGKKKELIHTITMEDEYLVSLENKILTCSAHIYKEIYKPFLRKEKVIYSYKLFIPYINTPYYQEDYNTNRILNTVEIMLLAKVDRYVGELIVKS